MKTSFRFILGLVILLSGCTGKHLINNKEYLGTVRQSFNERKSLAINRQKELFQVFSKDLSVDQEEALQFLFAFMPLSDLADYNGDFFLANVDMALRAKAETSWGKNIPEDIFLHYVLPCRVNNENLDSFRIVFYKEIMDRVRGKDMREAALEINHWCHEKVSYQPADIRTSAPLSTILSARGRCGEESTFTVAALRTAGIPARQVYVPRWAHSDDNHAWVEIWFNGEWYYMGACEPEPVLDRGWFTEPATRARLVHTKSFGAYLGNENSIIIKKNYSEINNLAKYAVTKKIYVKVSDKDGQPVKDARVEYQLYNYAEFYPLAIVPTDESGISQFETGLGDLLIWAYKNEDFDYKKISVNETDTLLLKLNRKAGGNYSTDLDLAVPEVRVPLPGPAPDLVEQNSKRINNENIIRQKYIDSWIKPGELKAFALKLGFDTARLKNIFARSMGNYNEIRSFLSSTPDTLRKFAVSMLEILPDKDLRDTKSYVLSDHLLNCIMTTDMPEGKDGAFFIDYVLNPRIANELIIDWRSYFRDNLPSELQKGATAEPALIVQYVNENIKVVNDENYYGTPLTPEGVNELKTSDSDSRAICFVAICRSLGIPSRLEPGSNVPQYYSKNNWNDVFFSDQKQPEKLKGYLKLFSFDTKPVPEYYIHFTIARFENGRYNTLEYDFNRKISDFKEELSLPPGNYMLVTGNRLSDSRILSCISFFDLAENEHKKIEVTLRKEAAVNKISGRIELNDVIDLFDKNETITNSFKNKGGVIVWIDPDLEPTKHIFNDLPLLKNEFDSWGGYFLFLTGSSQDGTGFRPESIKGLPLNTSFGTDKNMNVLKKMLEANRLTGGSLPFVIVSDKNGNILFTSSGYRIGMGEIILKKLLTTADI